MAPLKKTDPLHEIFDSGSARGAFIGTLAILSLFLLAQTIVVAKNFGRSNTPATDTVTVQGTGQAMLPPDVARISFAVEHAAVTVADAQSATTKQMDAVLEFIKKQGTEEKDIRTLSYAISPQYASVRCPKNTTICPPPVKITGYQVSETIQVTVRNLSAAGTLVGGLGKLGVQNVNGPAFALDDPTAGYTAARADAINKAKQQASILAKQLGVSLGKVVNFSESNGNGPYPMYGMGMGMMDAKFSSVPNIPAGENTYNSTVSVTYEIR